MRWRCSAATAENAHAERGRFAREERKIFRRRFRINDAIALALGKSGIGHGADANVIDRSQLRENWQKRLGAKRAIRADHLDVFVFQLRCGIRGADITVGGAFFRVSELRHDGQAGKRANGFNSDEQFFDVGKSFENVEVHAALFECQRLFVKNILDFFRSGMPRLYTESQRPDGAGNQDFAGSGFARFAGNLYATAVEALDFFGKSKWCELEAIRTKRISFDDVRARFDVGLVHAKYRFRLGRIQFVEAPRRTHGPWRIL